MKILVAFKRVPEPGTNGVAGSSQTERWTINPFDEVAIEAAVALKEASRADEVVGVSVGPAEVADQVRTGLARGLDRAIFVEEEQTLDCFSVARILAAVVGREQPDLVFLGKQAVDDDCAQIGPMLAGRLRWSQVTGISSLTLDETARTVECERLTDRGLETIRSSWPVVLTADLGLAEPRYVSLPAILRARRQPFEHLTAADLGIEIQPRIRVLSVAEATRRRQPVRVSSVQDLIAHLRDQEKVL